MFSFVFPCRFLLGVWRPRAQGEYFVLWCFFSPSSSNNHANVPARSFSSTSAWQTKSHFSAGSFGHCQLRGELPPTVQEMWIVRILSAELYLSLWCLSNFPWWLWRSSHHSHMCQHSSSTERGLPPPRLLILLGRVVKSLDSETVVFSEIHADQKVGYPGITWLHRRGVTWLRDLLALSLHSEFPWMHSLLVWWLQYSILCLCLLHRLLIH